MQEQPTFLIACSAAKASHSCEARDLYQGDLFRKSRAYAEQMGGRWLILSAKYGLLQPAALVDPYNLTLADLTDLERLQWGETVASQLDSARRYTFLAGRLYRDAVLASPHMNHNRSNCAAPLAGLGIGQQKAWLAQQLRSAEPARQPSPDAQRLQLALASPKRANAGAVILPQHDCSALPLFEAESQPALF